MGIIWEKDQLKLYKTLAEAGYNGVLFIHAEKESEIVPNLFYSGFPITHCFARSPDAEIQSIYDQIRFAEEAKFNGKMHIAHISTAEGVELVQEARKRGLNISCGVTPHHLIFDWRIMYKKDGLKWKMNPPLRYPGVPEKLFSCLKEGKIDWIETDHAPHTIDDKYKNLASGIPALPWWPLFIEYLRRYNFSDQRIKEITRDNILKRFNLDIRAHAHHLKDHRADYAFNPYEPLEKMLDWPVM
jgi:dihydroorotase